MFILPGSADLKSCIAVTSYAHSPSIFSTSVDNNRLEFSGSDLPITVVKVSNSSKGLRTCFHPRPPACTLKGTLTREIVHSSIVHSVKWFP